MTCFWKVIIFWIGNVFKFDVPSFPDLQNKFNLSPFEVELLLGINLTAHCFTALIVGNLADRYGKKPIILLGLGIFTIGSLFCVFATEYWHLLWGRVLQGVGISGPVVLSYLIVADNYSTEKQQQLMGVLNGTVTFVMAFAPVVGSYVNLFFQWQGNFAILLMLGIICFFLTIFFIQNCPGNPAVNISLKEYLPIFKSPKALYYITSICLLVQAYWVFIGISPILYMQDLGVSIKEFGFYQGTMAGVFSIASFSSGYFLKKFGTRNCFFFSMITLIAFIFANILLIIYQIDDPVIITIVMQLLAIGIIFPCNILWPLSLDAVPEAKGRFTALFVSVRLISTAAVLQLVSYFYQGTITPLSISMIIALILSFFITYKLIQEDEIFRYSQKAD